MQDSSERHLQFGSLIFPNVNWGFLPKLPSSSKGVPNVDAGDVVVVFREELLAVLSFVEDHSHGCCEINQAACPVRFDIIPAIVSPKPVNVVKLQVTIRSVNWVLFLMILNEFLLVEFDRS